MSTGILYIVSTPIGNAGDITLRALEILSQKADIILCEDTRQTLKLLRAHNIAEVKGRLESFFSATEKARTPSVIKMLASEGKNVALVSSRGTPAVSDPGFFLIKSAITAGVKVEPIPGPSAVISALVASGFPTDDFVFIGFLKRKPGKMKQQLSKALSSGIRTIVFFESAMRIASTLETLSGIFNDTRDVYITIAREMTKLYEDFIRGSIDEVKHKVTELAAEGKLKGEITVVLYHDTE